MRRFWCFWWMCAKEAWEPSAAFANDWQWLIGIPAATWAISYFLAPGSTVILVGHPILDAFLLAFIAFGITAFVAFSWGTLRAASKFFWHQRSRAMAAERRLAPRLRLEFGAPSSAQVREVTLGDGTGGVYVRVLPVCETDVLVDNCKGHLNGVYRRKTEADKWELTDLNERLTLSWSNVTTFKSAVMPGLRQHLDVLVSHQNGDLSVPVYNPPLDSRAVFRDDVFYWLEIVMSGTDTAQASINLQVHRTDDWHKPSVRVLGPTELEAV